jgi:hypothetical protein
MHLDRVLVAPSVRRMLDITKPGGVVYLSWRVTNNADLRDAHGRLYAAFDASLVRAELQAATLLLDEEVISASSGKTIHRLVVQKSLMRITKITKEPRPAGGTGRGLHVRAPLRLAPDTY